MVRFLSVSKTEEAMYQDLSIKGLGQELSITNLSIKHMGTNDVQVHFTFYGRHYTFKYVSTVWRDENDMPITPFLADLFLVMLKGLLRRVPA